MTQRKITKTFKGWVITKNGKVWETGLYRNKSAVKRFVYDMGQNDTPASQYDIAHATLTVELPDFQQKAGGK